MFQCCSIPEYHKILNAAVLDHRMTAILIHRQPELVIYPDFFLDLTTQIFTNTDEYLSKLLSSLHPSKCCEGQKSVMGNQGSFDRVFKSIWIIWDSGAAVEGAAISPCIDFLFGKPNYGKLCSDGLSNYRTLSHVPNSKRRIQNWSHNWSLCQFLWPWSALYRP